MDRSIKRVDVEAAIEDLENRTLAEIPGELARLIYLASTRDYNTGRYYHEGLASQFSEEVAGRALAACHRESFRSLVFASLEDLVKQVETYVNSAGARPAEVVETWEKLKPYQVAIPLNCDELFAQFFFSNLRIALVIFQTRQESHLDSPQSA